MNVGNWPNSEQMKTDTKQLIEIVGIFGVVASLVFVGMQFVFDRRVAIAGQYQSRAELRVQGILGQLDNEDLISDRANGWEQNRPGWWNEEIEHIFVQSEDSMATIARRQAQWEIFAVNMDNNYYQYKQGLLEEHIWEDFRQSITDVMRNPMRKAYYVNLSLPSLDEVIDEIVVEIDDSE